METFAFLIPLPHENIDERYWHWDWSSGHTRSFLISLLLCACASVRACCMIVTNHDTHTHKTIITKSSHRLRIVSSYPSADPRTACTYQFNMQNQTAPACSMVKRLIKSFSFIRMARRVWGAMPNRTIDTCHHSPKSSTIENKSKQLSAFQEYMCDYDWYTISQVSS